MTTKGPQNVIRRNFDSSKEMLMDFRETPRGPSPAAYFKHKQGRYNLLEIMSEIANFSNMFTRAAVFILIKQQVQHCCMPCFSSLNLILLPFLFKLWE